MPQKLSPVGDRVFSVALHGRGLSGLAITDRATVNYQCMWESFYHGIGEPPPPGAVPNINPALLFDWWRALNPREREIVEIVYLCKSRIAFWHSEDLFVFTDARKGPVRSAERLLQKILKNTEDYYFLSTRSTYRKPLAAASSRLAAYTRLPLTPG